MDYQALIDETRKRIENFNFDDSAYQAIYDEAKSHLDKVYGAQHDELDAALRQARQSAVGTNASDTKSLQEKLAMRGLAKSGESALLRLNQRLSLNNALSKLSNEALRSKTQLYAQHEKELAELATSLGKQKSAASEAEKRALYERLGELEERKAEDDFRRAELDVNAEIERLKATARAGSKNADGKKEEKQEENEAGAFDPEVLKAGFAQGPVNPNGNTPDYSAGRAADTIMKTCGAANRVIRSANMKARIYRELARLISTSNLSTDYAFEVLNVLKNHGFDAGFDISIAKSRELKDANYVYRSAYDKHYCDSIAEGCSVSEAASRAKSKAADEVRKMVNGLKISPERYRILVKMLWML